MRFEFPAQLITLSELRVQRSPCRLHKQFFQVFFFPSNLISIRRATWNDIESIYKFGFVAQFPWLARERKLLHCKVVCGRKMKKYFLFARVPLLSKSTISKAIISMSLARQLHLRFTELVLRFPNFLSSLLPPKRKMFARVALVCCTENENKHHGKSSVLFIF